MYGFYNLQDKIKRYFRLNEKELRGFLITTFVLALCLSFRQWGYGNKVNIAVGLVNLLNAFLITLLAMLVHVSAQKIYALELGYSVEYEMWIFGLILAFLLTILTNGYFFFIAVGGFYLHFLKGHRLGYFRYGLNYFTLGLIAFMGPLANILLALLFRYLSFMSSSPLIHEAVLINIYFALFSLIPIPPLDGAKIFYASRYLYFFSAGLIIGASFFLYSFGVLFTILGSLFVGALALLIPIYMDKPFG